MSRRTPTLSGEHLGEMYRDAANYREWQATARVQQLIAEIYRWQGLCERTKRNAEMLLAQMRERRDQVRRLEAAQPVWVNLLDIRARVVAWECRARIAEWKLAAQADVVEAATVLVRSGYDGPMMGPEVEPLFRAVVALEAGGIDDGG